MEAWIYLLAWLGVAGALAIGAMLLGSGILVGVSWAARRADQSRGDTDLGENLGPWSGGDPAGVTSAGRSSFFLTPGWFAALVQKAVLAYYGYVAIIIFVLVGLEQR